MFHNIHIKQHERGLRFRSGDFHGLVGAGPYMLGVFKRLVLREKLQVVNTLDTRVRHPLLDVIVKDEGFRKAVHVVDLKDTERALAWKDGRLAWILGPGRHVFWKEPYALEFEVFDIEAEPRFEHAQLDVVLRHADARAHLAGVEAAPREEVILFREGAALTRFREGRFVYWRDAGKVEVQSVDLREQTADVAGQEIMTRDKVTLRVNLVVTSCVVDALAAVTVVHDWAQALYREAQLALRAAVGARTLDTLLTDKEVVGDEIRGVLAKRAEAFGVEVRGVGLRDLILPGDMKSILNQVITAQKQAEANVIKRREETAAARSQANTAKLLADNPALARMKELELLQEILAGARTAFVFGRGDLATQVRTLIDREG